IIFKHAIIATGSYAIKLPGMPYHDHRIWNSTRALEIQDIPKKLLIVGGGIIGLEMGTVYHSLGSQIDIIDTGSQILPAVDKDVIKVFINAICKNFNLIMNSKILNVEAKKEGVTIFMQDHNFLQKSICYDAVLIAIGRAPRSQDLNLKSIGIICDDNNFIKVDNQLRTNISHIYAIGDVIGQPMLAHKGIHEGHIVAEVIAGKKYFFNPKVIPCVAYTNPEIAWVGITEIEAIKLKLNYETAVFPWSASGRSLASNSNIGLTKLIFDKNNHRIIGGLVIGKHASELLSEIALSIEMGCDAEDISLTIHPHPTLSESIGLASDIYQGTITDLINVKVNR
ncbi:MAG TPA: NAD(P)/FAD-dependent oxidoreductase, partial [Buchnera sp. (in: enterobacteria)]|nr:NAD(P)/FAD-dependent oxidoreductase [Buchnera sp. (in: enterobacteria)]